MKTSTGDEVDIVLEVGKEPIPIEVKYRDDIPDNMLKGFNIFLKNKKGCPFGIVVTRNVLQQRGNFVLIPLWIFLLMC